MRPQAPANARALPEPQRVALLKLLTDEDTAIYHLVREKILSYGADARPWLQPHLLSGDPVMRRRAQEIADHLDRQEADNRFLAFCVSHGRDLNAEEGVWLLAKTRYPSINSDAYAALLDSYAAEIRHRLLTGAGAEYVLATFNQFLFDELGFNGNDKEYYDPQNSYLNRVLDRRTGNPISLCLVFLFLARRLRIPLAGVGMPGHFICRYQSHTEELYVDVFNGGKLLTKADCVRYLQQTNQGFQENYLAPSTPLQILLRICSNLHQIHTQLHDSDEVNRLQRYIVALAK